MMVVFLDVYYNTLGRPIRKKRCFIVTEKLPRNIDNRLH